MNALRTNRETNFFFRLFLVKNFSPNATRARYNASCTKESLKVRYNPLAIHPLVSLEVLALRLVPHVGRARRREALAPLLAAELERAAPAGGRQARAEPGRARARAARALQRAPDGAAARHHHQRAAAANGLARGDGAWNDDTCDVSCWTKIMGRSRGQHDERVFRVVSHEARMKDEG